MKNKTLFAIFTSLIGAACSTQPFTQSLLADGATWEVSANEVDCRGVPDCKGKMKSIVADRGRFVCGQKPFRVMSCDPRMASYGMAKVKCMIRCGEKPLSDTPGQKQLEQEL